LIVDADGLDTDARLDAAVCVVGAGAAGIPLAVELGRAGIDVHLLEAGGFEWEQASQSLYDGESIGVDYHPTATRLRFFGGSMNHWGGMCRPLDPWDFEEHDWIPDSGWPIDRAELDPFYVRAQAVLDLAGFEYRFGELERDPERHPRLLGRAHGDFDSVVWQHAYRMRVGEKYRKEIEESERITCFLHAGVSEIVPDANARQIEHVDVTARSGRSLRFRARHFVLATGGIENPRLLLLSDSVLKAGLGNQNDLVGRYFMEHPNQHVGWMYVVPTPEATAYQEEVLQRNGEVFPGLPYNIVGLASSRAYQRERGLQGWSVNLQGAVRPLNALDTAAAEIGDVLASPLEGWMERGQTRKVRPYKLSCIAEQRPNPASRIRLGDERDRLGLRKVVVDWQLTDEDRRNLEETTLKLGIELARSGSARLRMRELDSLDWMPSGSGGHHMGTTRMSDDPRRGVANRHARVHGLANLHLAGSSLFPTGGYANPTLTLVALSLRLADRLAGIAELRG
jgi:choline dehydrogenase-like flavoprotein